jgi:hypothetical protein
MACFHPITAYRSEKGLIHFHEVSNSREIKVPCGSCTGCRLENSRQWAMRCVHEASLHEDNVFITLTYNPENIPPDGGLRKKHYQDFMKRLRKAIYPKKVRFYHCGEYGDKSNRPHYHAILFGHNFNDWIYITDSDSGSPIYTSPTLESIWNKGFVSIGEVNFNSAGYVARYCMKKINGKLADQVDLKTGLKPYERINSYTGELVEVQPEYATMSRRPGIGRDWISKYTSDCYPKDYTTIRGLRMRPPKYYDKYIRQIDEDLYDDIKAQRELQQYNSKDLTPERLEVREKVTKAKTETLRRSI